MSALRKEVVDFTTVKSWILELAGQKKGHPAGPSSTSIASFFSALAVTTPSLFIMNDIYDG